MDNEWKTECRRMLQDRRIIIDGETIDRMIEKLGDDAATLYMLIGMIKRCKVSILDQVRKVIADIGTEDVFDKHDIHKQGIALTDIPWCLCRLYEDGVIYRAGRGVYSLKPVQTKAALTAREKIYQRVQNSEKGQSFNSRSFRDICKIQYASVILAQLVRANKIERVALGWYGKL